MQTAPFQKYLLSWNVACVAAGPPTTKNGARSKQAKEFEHFLRDLGRDHCWSILCMQEFTSSNGDLVTETTEGQRVFATPPCPVQRLLATVVAAAFRKCIVNSSFRVTGRNCSIDVCWERKKFRVICSHLNPGSVMHMYARDLEDLSMLVTSRVNGAHVHICVDAQTLLGTAVLGSASSNIGSATTVTHRAEKQRLLECFIMEHSLTATNTFSNDDDRNTNIYTCNYHGADRLHPVI